MGLFQSDVTCDECLCMSGRVSPLLTTGHCSEVVQGTPHWAAKNFQTWETPHLHSGVEQQILPIP